MDNLELHGLDEKAWKNLLELIQKGKVTPFIGAGASAGTIPTARKIAKTWADTYHYPLADSEELSRVAEFLAIDNYPMYPKEHIISEFLSQKTPDFSNADEPHNVLAELNFPLYLTTNYDDFMFQALQRRRINPVTPDRDFCRWNEDARFLNIKPVVGDLYKFDPAKPLVYHLHGYSEIPQSLVLTESDYLDFLIRLQAKGRKGRKALLPTPIQIALATTLLLFVGYSLADWNFRVIFRGIISSISSTYPTIAVQIPPDDLTEDKLSRALNYLDQYFGRIFSDKKIKVGFYWGRAETFAKELRERWEKFRDA